MVLLGKGLVKKTKIIHKFYKFINPNEHDPTVEDSYKTSINLDGKDYDIEILDTAGEDDCKNMLDMWITFGEGFLLVFSIDNKESFEYTKKRYESIKKMKHKDQPVILVGNLKDCSDKERKVSYNEANQLANSLGVDYFEVSSENGFNVVEVFKHLARKIIQFKEKIKKNKKGKKCQIL